MSTEYGIKLFERLNNNEIDADNIWIKSPRLPPTHKLNQPLQDHKWGIPFKNRIHNNIQSHDVNMKFTQSDWGNMTQGPKPSEDYPMVLFPHTHLSYEQEYNTDTLLINVGESWCYGGDIRDMNFDFTESMESLQKAMQYTMGPWMADRSRADLHQFTYPGNNNVAMVNWLDHNLVKLSQQDKYKKILVVMQHTEHCREFAGGYHSELISDPGMAEMMRRDQLNHNLNTDADSKYADPQEFNRVYWEALQNWLDNILQNARLFTGKSIECMTWGNFLRIPITRNRSFDTIPESWNEFSQNLEGGPAIPDIEFFNTHAFQHIMQRNVNYLDTEWLESTLDKMEQIQQWWADSAERLELHNYYPSPVNHMLWASRIINQAGWLTYDTRAV